MSGHSLDELAFRLRLLRTRGYRVAALKDLHRMASGEAPVPPGRGPLVAFTVDDGYADFTRAAHVFHDHGCPVTVFLSSGFLDRECWFWWDQVEFILARAPSGRVELRDRQGGLATFQWSASPAAREATQDALIRFLKTLPEDRFAEANVTIGTTLGISLPREAPDVYRPMGWQEVRECRRLGVEFAPHTVTHPILANVSEAVARSEISRSFARLKEELDEVVPILAYPNGDHSSFGPREERLAREVGLAGAVSTVPAYWDLSDQKSFAEAAFRMPRFSYPEDWGQFAHILSGIERVKPGKRQSFGAG